MSDIKVNFSFGNLINIKSDNLVFFVFEKELAKNLTEIDKKLDNFVSNIIKKKYFSGADGQIHPIYTHNKINAEKIIMMKN